MREPVQIDLNDMASVILTPRGSELLMTFTFQKVLPGEVFRTELWKLMNIFGNEMRFGTDPIFKGGKISVESMKLAMPESSEVLITHEPGEIGEDEGHDECTCWRQLGRNPSCAVHRNYDHSGCAILSEEFE